MNPRKQPMNAHRQQILRTAFGLAIAVTGLALLPGCHPGAEATPRRMDKIPEPPPAGPERRDLPIDPALQQAARAELVAGASSTDPIIRSHAIEAMRETIGADSPDIIIKHLSDPVPVVRFSAALAAGELRLPQAREALLVLLNDSDPSVRIGAIFALHRLGDASYSHNLETTSRDPSARTRSDTALVLGLLGEPSASRVLVPMLRDNNAAVHMQAAEALWRMDDERGLDALVAGSLSQHPDDQMIAILALAGPKDRAALGHIEGQLTNDYPEVMLVAARAAGMLGSDAGFGVAVNLSQNPKVDKKDDPAVIAKRTADQRLLAALAFGAIGRTDAQPYLAPLLKDPNPDIRVAAASALLQLHS